MVCKALVKMPAYNKVSEIFLKILLMEMKRFEPER